MSLPRIGVVALFTLACLVIGGAHSANDFAEKQSKLAPAQPYTLQRSNPVIYEVDFAAVVTLPYKCKTLKVWLPIPQNDAGQEVELLEISSFPMEMKPKIDSAPM